MNKKHTHFVIEVFSQTLGKFVTRFKDAHHSSLERAQKVVSKFKECRWQIQGFHAGHQKWHVVDSGNPLEA